MTEIAKRYNDAVQSFVDKVKVDPNVIAVLVYGSVSHGTVWEKSDIDITLVVRDQKMDRTTFGIYEDDLILSVQITQRSGLKRWMEKNTGGMFGHSIDATTKIVYTTDESLYDYIEENRTIGKADAEKAIFFNLDWVLNLMNKAAKWLAVKNDPEYARLYIIKAAETMAQIEVCSKCIPPTREALLQAREINPAFYEKFFARPMAGPMTKDEIHAMLEEMTAYILTHMPAVMNVVEDFFGDGEIKTGTQIGRYFNSDMHEMHGIMDFLCEHAGLEKISQTIRLTPKGRQNVEEVAFILPR